jgi:hypothetical protein
LKSRFARGSQAEASKLGSLAERAANHDVFERDTQPSGFAEAKAPGRCDPQRRDEVLAALVPRPSRRVRVRERALDPLNARRRARALRLPWMRL